MAFFQSNVEETGCSRRRSFRKYRRTSSGIAVAAAMAAGRVFKKWGIGG
jgi:hypothetical protein